jgi:protein-tyrosine phosphatase
MIDLHCHILPDLDDGANDWGQAVAMARVACGDGITDIVCTPHWVPGKYDNTRPVVMEQVDTFRRILAEAAIPLKIHAGMELRLDITIPGRIRSGELLTVADRCVYALIELPDESLPDHLDEFFWNLAMQHIKPVISHVERNSVFRDEPRRLFSLVVKGCLTQITAASLVGNLTSEVREFAAFLLENRLAHIMVTDSHGLRTRKPILSEGFAAATAIVGEKAARRMVYDIPQKILNGQYIDIPDPLPIRRKRTFFSFLNNILNKN